MILHIGYSLESLIVLLNKHKVVAIPEACRLILFVVGVINLMQEFVALEVLCEEIFCTLQLFFEIDIVKEWVHNLEH